MANLALITLQPGYARPQELGPGAAAMLEGAGHSVTCENLKADLARLKGVLVAALADPRFDALLLVGDLSPADQELVAIHLEPLMERRLQAFDHMARQLLFQEEGVQLLFSWFLAGSQGNRLLLALPGPPERLTRLLEHLVVPQMSPLLDWAQR